MLVKNKIDKSKYFWLSFLPAALALAGFIRFCFQPLYGMSVSGSLNLLKIGSAILFLIGILVTSSRGRNWGNVLINIFLPISIYAVAMTFPRFSVWNRGMVIITVAIAIISFLMVVCRKIPSGRRNNRGEVIKRRVIGGIFTVRVTVMAFLVFYLLVIGLGTWMDSVTSNNVANDRAQWTMANNKETILKLKPEVWETLSVEERLEVLTVVKNIELRYLGVQKNIELEVGKLDYMILGAYVFDESKIVISEEYVKYDSVEEVLHTVAHECHHVYSREQVKALECLPESYRSLRLFNNARIYEDEYDNYISGTVDYNGYSLQLCEIEADLYADAAVEDYYKGVEKYEKEKGAD